MGGAVIGITDGRILLDRIVREGFSEEVAFKLEAVTDETQPDM